MAERLRVLVVDDDDASFLRTRRALDGLGWALEVDWAATYSEALYSMRAGAHDVYIVDPHLGLASGVQLVRRGRQDGCRAAVLLCAAGGEDELARDAERAGADGCLVKEFAGFTERGTFEAALRAVLEPRGLL